MRLGLTEFPLVADLEKRRVLEIVPLQDNHFRLKEANEGYYQSTFSSAKLKRLGEELIKIAEEEWSI